MLHFTINTKGSHLENRLTQRILGTIVLAAIAFIFLSLLTRPITHSKFTPQAHDLDAAAIPLVEETTPVRDRQIKKTVQENPLPTEQVIQQTLPNTSNIVQKKVTTLKDFKDLSTTCQWIVQLGVFMKADNAKKLTQTLKAKGFNADSRTRIIRNKPMTQVLIGPFNDRKQALALQTQPTETAQLESIILSA